MNEYELLRDEILKDYEGIRQYECILYTVVAAILSFAIGAKQYLLCLKSMLYEQKKNSFIKIADRFLTLLQYH